MTSLAKRRRDFSPAAIRRRAKGEVIKINIGGGANPQPGCINMDLRDLPQVDVVHDWDDFPWPFPSDIATIIIAAHVVEHVDPARFGFLRWMEECWRILKVGGQLLISTPFAGSLGYWSDPTHCNGCTNRTWEFFDPAYKQLYPIYSPKPWKIQNCFWAPDGNMEVIMVKRAEGDLGTK